mgnify:CR=1 FL=1
MNRTDKSEARPKILNESLYSSSSRSKKKPEVKRHESESSFEDSEDTAREKIEETFDKKLEY